MEYPKLSNLAYNLKLPAVPVTILVIASPVNSGLLYQPTNSYPSLVGVGNNTSSLSIANSIGLIPTEICDAWYA